MYTPYDPYKFYNSGDMHRSLTQGVNDLGANYTEVTESQAKKQQKAKEIKANIPKRSLMLEKVSSDILILPLLPSVLWKEIAEYEGGVESSLLGQEENSSTNGVCSWCNIL